MAAQVNGSVDPRPFVGPLLVGLLPSRSSVALDVKTNDKSLVVRRVLQAAKASKEEVVLSWLAPWHSVPLYTKLREDSGQALV